MIWQPVSFLRFFSGSFWSLETLRSPCCCNSATLPPAASWLLRGFSKLQIRLRVAYPVVLWEELENFKIDFLIFLAWVSPEILWGRYRLLYRGLNPRFYYLDAALPRHWFIILVPCLDLVGSCHRRSRSWHSRNLLRFFKLLWERHTSVSYFEGLGTLLIGFHQYSIQPKD